MKHMIYDSDADTDGFAIDDERMNLSTKKAKRDIIVIADLGLWDGRHMGYKVLSAGSLSELFSVVQGDSFKLYYDDETDNVVMEDSHHDGTNVYTFREAKAKVDYDGLLDLIYYEKATDEDIDRYTTPLGKYVRKIYGWNKAAQGLGFCYNRGITERKKKWTAT